MGPRPRCPVCRSKRWHRDALSGSIVCEEGHLLQGYVQETTETQEGPSQHTQTTRRLRKNKQRKQRPPNNAYLHGDRARFLVWQAIQLVFREQLRIAIDELGWPAEIEGVARDLWGMLVASSNVPAAPRDYENDDEPPTSYTGPRPGDRYTKIGRRKKPKPKKKRRRRRGQFDSDDEEDEEDAEDDAGGTGDGGRAGEAAGAATDTEKGEDDSSGNESDASSYFSAADADDERGPAGAASRPNSPSPAPGPAPQPDPQPPPDDPDSNLYFPPPKRPPRRSTAVVPTSDPREAPRMEFTLLVLYLACVTLRLPVFLSDILHLAETYQIPYLDAGLRLPAIMQNGLSQPNRAILSPSTIPQLYPLNPLTNPKVSQTDSAQGTLARMVGMFKDDWEIEFPEANVPLLTGRVCGLMGLPPLAQTLTSLLLTHLPLSSHFRLPSSLSPSSARTSFFRRPASSALRDRAVRWPFAAENAGLQDWRTALPEVKVASLVVVVCRMLWAMGNEAKEGGAAPLAELAPLLPDRDVWLSAIERLAGLDKPGDPSQLWSKDAVEMRADDIDAYLDFFESKIVSKEKVPARMTDLSRYFRDLSSSFSDPTAAPDPSSYLSSLSSILDSLYSPSVSSAADSSENADHSSRPTLTLLQPLADRGGLHSAPSPSSLPTPLRRLFTVLASHVCPVPLTASLPTAWTGPAPTTAENGVQYLLGFVAQVEGALSSVSVPEPASEPVEDGENDGAKPKKRSRGRVADEDIREAKRQAKESAREREMEMRERWKDADEAWKAAPKRGKAKRGKRGGGAGAGKKREEEEEDEEMREVGEEEEEPSTEEEDDASDASGNRRSTSRTRSRSVSRPAGRGRGRSRSQAPSNGRMGDRDVGKVRWPEEPYGGFRSDAVVESSEEDEEERSEEE
ncbi:hypothetical protein JCM8097_008539 [Rhodosporidiobolus ruineniae]